MAEMALNLPQAVNEDISRSPMPKHASKSRTAARIERGGWFNKRPCSGDHQRVLCSELCYMGTSPERPEGR